MSLDAAHGVHELHTQKQQVEQALVDLDRAVKRVLEASVIGPPKADLGHALIALDEARGRIWGAYDHASDVLKKASKERDGAAEDV